MENGEAAAAGRLCVAAVQLGPEQADAVRRIAVQLIASGSAATAATMAEAFWREAAAAGRGAGAPSSPGPVTPHKRAARTLAEAARSELTAGAAALGPGQPGSPVQAAAAGAAAPSAAEPAPPAAQQPALPPSDAQAAGEAAQPSAGELQAAAAVVLAAAVVEAVGRGHAVTVVQVTELLLEAGQQELVAALVATMVEAGEGLGAGALPRRRAAGMLAGWQRGQQRLQLPGCLACGSSKRGTVPVLHPLQATAGRRGRCHWKPWRAAATAWSRQSGVSGREEWVCRRYIASGARWAVELQPWPCCCG